MKQCFYDAAKLIHSTLKAESTCWRDDHKILFFTHIVVIDDDITSALWGAKLFYEVKKEYNYEPVMLCVGGKGLMSKHTHKKSEAELLSYVLKKLNIPARKINLLGEGRNSGDNVLSVAAYMAHHDVETARLLWCATQRLSLRLERTVAQQAPQINSRYFVIEQSIDEVMRLYNGKGLCDGQMLLHELASILNRCDAYSGTFQKPLEFEVPTGVREAAKLLEDNFRLKLPHKNLKSYWQLVQLYFAILWNKGKMKQELEQVIVDFREQLQSEKLI